MACELICVVVVMFDCCGFGYVGYNCSVVQGWLCCLVVGCVCFFFLMIRRPPRSTQSRSSAASDVYKRQILIGAALLAAISLNQVRAGDGAFISNLWGSNATEASADLYLEGNSCLLYTSPSPRDRTRTRMPSSA